MPTFTAALALVLSLPPAPARPTDADSVLICMAPVAAQMNGAGGAEATTAVREAFGSYLTGPTLGVVTLASKLPSQAREEAKRAHCHAVLFTTVKHERGNAGGLLEKVAGRVETQAWQVAAKARSATTRDLAQATAKTARDVAGSIKNKDEMTLTYRLESLEGAILVSGSDKRRASADGDDVLTPLIEKAAEAIASAAQRN